MNMKSGPLAAFLLTLLLAGCAEPGGPTHTAPSSPVPAGMPSRLDTNNLDRDFARAATAAEAAGWSVADNRFLVDGEYTFETWSGDSGQITFENDQIAYAVPPGDDAFTRYVHMRDDSRPDRPTLVAMSREGSDEQSWLLPMTRDDEILLVSIQNRDQWIRLERTG